MKKIIFPIVGIAILIVVYLVAYTLFDFSKMPDIKKVFVSGNKEKLYKLPSIIVNLSDKHFLRTKVSILVLGDIKEVEKKKSVLLDNMIIISSAFNSKQLLSVEGKELLKEKLLLNFNSVLENSKVVDIYYEEFIVQ